MLAPTSKRRSTSIEIRRSRLASERPPKKGVATRNAFRSGELAIIGPIYCRSRNLAAPCGGRVVVPPRVKMPAHQTRREPLLSENALVGKPVLLPVDDLCAQIVACDDLDLRSLPDDHTTLPASAGRSTTFIVEARHRALMRLGPGRAETDVFRQRRLA